MFLIKVILTSLNILFIFKYEQMPMNSKKFPLSLYHNFTN